MTDPTDFTKMVPGFDFLQGLVKNAGASLPNVGHWIAPTLDPEEIEKRIEELRTVQFWLEQNARMLGATIQALEVQRMTLTTLKTMNVQLGDLAESLKIRMPEPAPADDEPKAASRYAYPPKAPEPEPEPEAEPQDAAAPQVPPGVPDPMQWWGALTQQFSELAANAMKDSNTEAARNLASTMVKQGFEAASAASETMKKAAASMAVAKPAAKPAARTADSAAASTPASAKGAAKKSATGTAAKKAAAKTPAAKGR